MEDSSEYFDDEEEEEDGVDWEAYQAEMYARKKAFESMRRIKLTELFENCMKPLLFGETCQKLSELIALCIIVNVTCRYLHFLPKFVARSFSTCCGLVLIYRWFESLALYLVTFAFASYAILIISSKCERKNVAAVGAVSFSFVYTFVLQTFWLDAVDMTRIRGALMIMVMKVISLAFDPISTPNVFQFSTYVFSASSIIFGPWISFDTHRKLFDDNSNFLLALIKGVVSLLAAVVCLIYSACLVEWLLPDGYAYYNKWIIGYRDAQSFRFSHYFVCFISQSTIFASGFNENDAQSRSFRVADPLSIEFPRSLVDVVVNWNVPMHNWLKIYAFRPFLRFGKVGAVFFTYTASSLLHGFNFQLSAVLFSLGFSTYAEHVLREKLARSFGACIRARRCQPDCDHQYKKWHPFVFVTNVGFSLLSVFHLAYLGMVFDSGSQQESGYSMEHTLSVWQNVGFVGHYIFIGTFIFAKII